MVTRRVHGRAFRLRPSEQTNAIIRYVVAVVAERTRVEVHALCVMSNHWHVCLTDTEGRVCEFTRDCHAMIARAINAKYGDFESVWSSDQTSHVACAAPEDLIGKIAYTMANPVAARLVRRGRSWPGVRAAWPAKPRTVRRPRVFFRDEADGGSWPSVAVLKLSRPPGYDELSDGELAAMIDGAIGELEECHRRTADREGKSFLGRRGVRAQCRYGRPSISARRFQRSPRVACRDKWRRIEWLARDRAWSDAYAEALTAWRTGDRSAVFPYGTYQMRVVHNVSCVPPPT